MARGWESKSIESQIEAAEDRQRLKGAPQSTADVNLARRRESLELSRTRVLHDLAASRNPRHKAQLESALADLDARLAKLHP